MIEFYVLFWGFFFLEKGSKVEKMPWQKLQTCQFGHRFLFTFNKLQQLFSLSAVTFTLNTVRAHPSVSKSWKNKCIKREKMKRRIWWSNSVIPWHISRTLCLSINLKSTPDKPFLCPLSLIWRSPLPAWNGWDKRTEVGGIPKLPVLQPPALDLGLRTLEGGERGPCWADVLNSLL